MVLLQMVGKKRPFLRGLALTVLTFGIYGVYWLYKAHDELFKQFELEREGRDEGVVWLILGLVLFPFQFVYMWMFVGNVQYLRDRLALPRGLSPGGFIGLQIAAYLSFAVIYVGAVVSMVGTDPDATDEEVAAAFAGLVGFFLLGVVLALGFMGFAYYRLQSDINGVWDAYSQRVGALSAANAAAAAGSGPAPSYWGDLSPPGPPPALSAPHVRARFEAMTRDNPGIVLAPELPDLLARGEAGEADALAQAAGLLSAADARLAERARLLADLAEADRRQGRLAGRLANGEVDAAAYASARADLDRERARLQARLAEVEAGLFTPSASTG